MNLLRNIMKIDNKGVTLIELMVALAMTGLISIPIIQVYANSSKSYTKQQAIVNLQQSLRGSIAIMYDNISMIGFDPLLTDNFGIESATSTKIIFTSDINMNGIIDDIDLERISYDLTDKLQQILYEGTLAEMTETLIDKIDIANSSFTYLDVSGNDLGTPVANPENIRKIIILLTAKAHSPRVGDIDRTSLVQVNCRNLYF